MKSIKWMGLLTLVSCFFVIGCGGGGDSATVADGDDIASFVANNPDLEDETLEPEEVDPSDE